MKVMLLALSIPHLVRVIRSNRSVVLHFEITRGESFEIPRQTDVKPSPLPRSVARRFVTRQTIDHCTIYFAASSLSRYVAFQRIQRKPVNPFETPSRIHPLFTELVL